MKLFLLFRETSIYKKAFQQAMEIFEMTKSFPREEIYSLSDQIKRSSRAVCSNYAEGHRKRRYEAHFIANYQIAIWKILKPLFG